MFQITTRSDSSFADDVSDRHSSFGFYVTINKNVVTWVAKKTPNVALSSTEAEYVAMAEATRMTSYVSNIIESLDLHTQKPSNVGTDNKGAMDLGNTNATTRRSKHIDVRHHYVQEQQEQGKIKLFDIDGKKNPADIFTKPLAAESFNQYRNVFVTTIV